MGDRKVDATARPVRVVFDLVAIARPQHSGVGQRRVRPHRNPPDVRKLDRVERRPSPSLVHRLEDHLPGFLFHLLDRIRAASEVDDRRVRPAGPAFNHSYVPLIAPPTGRPHALAVQSLHPRSDVRIPRSSSSVYRSHAEFNSTVRSRSTRRYASRAVTCPSAIVAIRNMDIYTVTVKASPCARSGATRAPHQARCCSPADRSGLAVPSPRAIVLRTEPRQAESLAGLRRYRRSRLQPNELTQPVRHPAMIRPFFPF